MADGRLDVQAVEQARKQPHATALRAAPGGNGALIRFRGRPIIATLPVATSISTRSITSIRRLQRSRPASEPSSSRSNRPSLPHGHGARPLPGHRDVQRRQVAEAGGLRGAAVSPVGLGVADGSGEAGPSGSDGSGVSSTSGADVQSGGGVSSGCSVSSGSGGEGRVEEVVGRGDRRAEPELRREHQQERRRATTARASPGRRSVRVASTLAAMRQMASAMLMIASAGRTPGVTTQARIAVNPPPRTARAARPRAGHRREEQDRRAAPPEEQVARAGHDQVEDARDRESPSGGIASLLDGAGSLVTGSLCNEFVSRGLVRK